MVNMSIEPWHAINDQSFDGVAWRQAFATDGSVQAIDLAYPEFEAVHRARRIENTGAIDPAHITQLGFLIADKKRRWFFIVHSENGNTAIQIMRL